MKEEKKILHLTVCKNKAVHNYVMNDLVWKIDLPYFPCIVPKLKVQ